MILIDRSNYHSHFTDEEIKAQRSRVYYLNHSKRVLGKKRECWHLHQTYVFWLESALATTKV